MQRLTQGVSSCVSRTMNMGLARSFAVPCRQMATKRQIQFKKVASKKAASATGSKVPFLSSTLKKFVFTVHPDRLHHDKTAHDLNQESLTALNSFISSLKGAEEDDMGQFPEMGVSNLRFLVPEKGSDTLRPVNLRLRSTGGISRESAKQSLGKLFEDVGLPADFRWDTDYFKFPHMKVYEQRETKAEREQREKAAEGYYSS